MTDIYWITQKLDGRKTCNYRAKIMVNSRIRGSTIKWTTVIKYWELFSHLWYNEKVALAIQRTKIVHNAWKHTTIYAAKYLNIALFLSFSCSVQFWLYFIPKNDNLLFSLYLSANEQIDKNRTTEKSDWSMWDFVNCPSQSIQNSAILNATKSIVLNSNLIVFCF